MASHDFDLHTFITPLLIIISIYILGLYLQIKLIKTIKVERSMTWEINMCHSIIMIFHYTFTFAFELTTHVLVDPSIMDYTGSWFCYASFFIRCYGLFSIFLHSLVICVYKYLFIIHDKMVRSFGEKKMKKLIMFIYLIHPVFLSLSFMARSMFFASSPTLERCGLHQPKHDINSIWYWLSVGNKGINSNVTTDPKGGMLKRFFFCGIDDDDVEDGTDYFFYVVNQFYCLLQSFLAFGVLVNMFEIFFYVKIFRFIKR